MAESLLVPLEEVAQSHPMKPPYVVKPVAEGSSVGVHIVLEGANAPVKAVLDERAIFGSHAMVERFVPGRELTCAVIGDRALGVIDIVSKGSGWYDYEAKYAPGGSQHILPAQIPADVYKKCQDYALTAHNALGCRGVSRTDFRFKGFLMAVLIAPMVVPIIVVGVATYLYFAPLGLADSYFGLIAVHAALGKALLADSQPTAAEVIAAGARLLASCQRR